MSSPLLRARDTARAVADALDLPLHCDERLAELSYGDWEGLAQAEVKRRWPDGLRQWKRSPSDARPAGGESIAEARERLLSFLRDRPWDAGNPPGPILIVTHSGIIRIARLEAERRPLSAFREAIIAPASLYSCRLLDGLLWPAAAVCGAFCGNSL